MEATRPAQAQADSNFMSNILNAPSCKTGNVSLPTEKWEEMVRRQDDRTGRLALTNYTKRAIMKETCDAKSERHTVLNSVRREMRPNSQAGYRGLGAHIGSDGDRRDVVSRGRARRRVGQSVESRTLQGKGKGKNTGERCSSEKSAFRRSDFCRVDTRQTAFASHLTR